MIEKRRCCWLAGMILLCAATAAAAHGSDDLFPRPKQLLPAIHFWTRVYTEVDTDSGFIHDAEHLGIVYETVHFHSSSHSARRRQVEREAHRYRAILTKLGSGARKGLSKEERRVLNLWPKGTTSAEFRHAAKQIRFQLGQSDRFRAGLVRSGKWKSYIEQTLKANGMPIELAALPHVESSFNPTAYSKVGASGMWQFTRSTGLRYMRIDHIVDERRDPYMSTKAAVRQLKDNYDVLHTWPLAITAYNHGQAGMRRAAKEFGPHIGVIVKQYHSRTFGFASRNFYAGFLAALDVDRNAKKYFGDLEISPPLDTVVAPVPDYVRADTLAHALHISVSALHRLNPALMDTVWHGDKFVPKSFPLRLPESIDDPGELLADIPMTERYTAQEPDVQHRVRRGETLSQIASEYHVSLASLVRVNGLRNSDFIRTGQVLALPIPAKTPPLTLAAANGANGGEYVVRRGDSLDGIARAFNVDVADLLAANNIRDKNLIIAGQKLRLPSADSDDVGSNASVELTAAVDTPATRGEPIPVAAAAVSAGAIAVPAVARAAAGAAVAIPASAASLGGGPDAIDAAPADDDDASASGADDSNDGGTFDSSALDADDAADSGDAGDGADSSDAGAADSSSADDAPDADDDATLDANVLSGGQADLAADPSDYSVSDDGTITVQSLETLGHYADWLGIRTQRLRDINGLPFRRAVVIGQSLKLDFSHISPQKFEQRRVAYHQKLQEDFFSRYRITSVEKHVVQRGESLWVLALHDYSVPIWLLRQYNPDLDLDHVAPGVVVKFPRLETIADEDGA